MAALPEMKALESRKRDLVLESEVNRELLHLEVTRIRLSVARLRSSFAGHGVWKWLAPVAGFLLARRFSGNSGFIAKGSMVLSLLGSAWKLWSGRKRRGPTDEPGI